MVKKEITNVIIEHRSDTDEILIIIDYNLILFNFVKIPMATGGFLFNEFPINSSEEIFEIANLILN